MTLSALEDGMRRIVLLAFALAGLAAGALLPASASAAVAQLALSHPVQVFPAETSVTGVRLNLLLGLNQDVTGLDVGIAANRTSGDQLGLQIAPYNEVGGDLTGAALGALLSDVGGELRGLQLTGIANVAARGTGAQVSALYNEADSLRGLQLGLVNVADDLEGLQLGLINVNPRGFLPVFPLFNFGY